MKYIVYVVDIQGSYLRITPSSFYAACVAICRADATPPLNTYPIQHKHTTQ
jgi:hypothetical protein